MVKIAKLKIEKSPVLDAVLYSPEDNKSHPGILMSHGLASRKEEFMDLPEKLAKVGFHVLTFDFSGHGKSEGARVYITSKSHLDDVKRALKTLLDQPNLNKDGVVVLGHSLGTTAALRAANTELGQYLKGIILLAPPSRIIKNIGLIEWGLYKTVSVLAEKILKFTGKHIYIPYRIRPKDIYVDKQAMEKGEKLGLLEKILSANNYQYLVVEHDNCEYAAFIEKPVLVMVGNKDLVISNAHSKTVYEKLASNDKEWIEIEDSGHSLAGDHKNQEVFEKIKQWLDRIFKIDTLSSSESKPDVKKETIELPKFEVKKGMPESPKSEVEVGEENQQKT